MHKEQLSRGHALWWARSQSKENDSDGGFYTFLLPPVNLVLVISAREHGSVSQYASRPVRFLRRLTLPDLSTLSREELVKAKGLEPPRTSVASAGEFKDDRRHGEGESG